MIRIWNRKEVYIGDSAKRFEEIKDILSKNGIDYTYKSVDKKNPNLFRGRGSIGIPFVDDTFRAMHYIYTYNKDYDKVMSLIRAQ